MKNKYLFISVVGFILLFIIVFMIYFGLGNDNSDIGKEEYQKHCANCHGMNGEGLRDLIPPLNDKKWLYAENLVCILKYGLNDTIIVNDKKYFGVMPSNPKLENDEIAAIICYMRNEFIHENNTISIKEVNEARLKCNN